MHSLRAMKNTSKSTGTPDQRIARRERGRHSVRSATRGAIVGGIALSAIFAGVSYHATQAKTSAVAVSATPTSSGHSSNSSQSTVSAQSTATPVAASGGS